MSDDRPADIDPLVEQLAETQSRLEETESDMERFGRERIEELASAYREFAGLLDRYEDEVVGDAGDVKTNIEFQSQIADTVSNIPGDVLLRGTFVECADHLKQRWFKPAHFEHVREQLEPVRDIVARLDAYEEARADYRQARKDARNQLSQLDRHVADLERLVELGDADIDAPTERLREPIEAYNETATEAFETFIAEQSAREVSAFLEATRAYPLVEFEVPPEDLRSYLQEAPVGEERLSKLLEYAGYSRSKLEHYVDDPDRFAHVFANQKTYFSKLSAEPLRISWPPPAATRLRWRCEELTAVLNRLSPAAVEQLRAVAALPRETDYDRLQTSAVAREQLTDEERSRLRSGDVEQDLEHARQQRQRLEQALEDHS